MRNFRKERELTYTAVRKEQRVEVERKREWYTSSDVDAYQAHILKSKSYKNKKIY